MDPATIKRFEEILSEFTEATGKTAEEGMRRIAKSACRRLASTVQPMGLNGKGKMDKFVKSIGYQVDRVWYGTNIGALPDIRDMKDAHYKARVNGRVPRIKYERKPGQKWLSNITRQERNDYKRIAQGKAFRAKAAWVKISNDLGKPKMSKVSADITRHLSDAKGNITVTGKGIQVALKISNDTSYIRSIQSDSDIAQAATEGMSNGLKWMLVTSKKAIEKANKKLQ